MPLSKADTTPIYIVLESGYYQADLQDATFRHAFQHYRIQNHPYTNASSLKARFIVGYEFNQNHAIELGYLPKLSSGFQDKQAFRVTGRDPSPGSGNTGPPPEIQGTYKYSAVGKVSFFSGLDLGYVYTFTGSVLERIFLKLATSLMERPCMGTRPNTATRQAGTTSHFSG